MVVPNNPSNAQESHPSDTQENPLVSRRKFIVGGAMGAVGLTLAPSLTVRAATPIVGGVFLRFLGQLATNVAFGVVGNYVYDYLKSLYPGQRDYALSQYNSARNRGYYSEPGWGVVYGPRRYYGSNLEEEGEERPAAEYQKASLPAAGVAQANSSYVFFPLLMLRDQINGLAQFINLVGGGYFTGWLAGPSVVGLRLAARDMLSEGIYDSERQLRRALLPKCQSSVSLGVFQRSYMQPDVFCSDNGAVAVNYGSNGRGDGEVRVTYRENVRTGQRTVFDQKYGLEYS